ncbi:MAG: serine protease [Desulfatibacillaceae bacterium]
MLQNIHYQYRNACMMLFQREAELVGFQGTAFLIHGDGYLLTAAHLITANQQLMVAPVEEVSGFTPIHTDTVAPIEVEVARIDWQRDLALLRFIQEIDVTMPDHVMGVPEDIPVGASVACMGFPFGHYSIYNQLIKQAVVCSKISSGNETRLFLFDTMVHDGTRGGPLINVHDGRIIGVVGGRFSPQEIVHEHLRKTEMPIRTHISYAISLEHAEALMEQEGLSLGIEIVQA